MGVCECGLGVHDFDVVECEIFQNALALHIDDLTLMVHEIVDGEIFLERIIDPVKAALLEAGKVERGFAKGLAGNGASVDATAAHMFGALDNGDAFAEIGGLRGALFPRRAATDHDEVESVAQNHAILRRVFESGAAIRIPEDCRGRGDEEAELSCWSVPESRLRSNRV